MKARTFIEAEILREIVIPDGYEFSPTRDCLYEQRDFGSDRVGAITWAAANDLHGEGRIRDVKVSRFGRDVLEEFLVFRDGTTESVVL